LDPEIAADIVYVDLSQKARKHSLETMIGDVEPYAAAGAYYIHDVIDPRDTRTYLIKVLQVIRGSKGKGMSKHRLANWPTKF
jgi:methylmalonyl-CoA decarboxylase subunit alpha